MAKCWVIVRYTMNTSKYEMVDFSRVVYVDEQIATRDCKRQNDDFSIYDRERSYYPGGPDYWKVVECALHEEGAECLKHR